MVHALGPERVFGIQPSLRIGGQDAADIPVISARAFVGRVAMPRDIENADHAAVVFLDRADYGVGRHVPAQGVVPHPGVGVEIAIIGSFRGECLARRRQQTQHD